MYLTLLQRHYDIHGNSLVMQENFGFSSSLTIRRLHRESGSLHLPTDHSLSLEMPQSQLIPISFNEATGRQSDSIKSQDMIFHPCHQQRDEVSGTFIGYILSFTCYWSKLISSYLVPSPATAGPLPQSAR